MDWSRVGKQLGFLVAFALVGYTFRALMRRLAERDRWYVALIWLTVCAFGADWSGLHFMVGAFLAGAIMDTEWFDQERMDLLRHHVLLVVMPVFFPSTGLRTNWTLGGEAVFVAAGILLDKQVISSEAFTALLLMAVASTMLTVPVVAPKLQRLREIGLRSN